eukprot:451974_1
MAARKAKKKSKKVDRSNADPLWFIGVQGTTQDMTAGDLKTVAAILNTSVSGNKSEIKATVDKAASTLIENKKKRWKRTMKIFKTLNYVDMNRFSAVNDSDFVFTDVALDAMNNEKATCKDLLINSLKRNGKTKKKKKRTITFRTVESFRWRVFI